MEPFLARCSVLFSKALKPPKKCCTAATLRRNIPEGSAEQGASRVFPRSRLCTDMYLQMLTRMFAGEPRPVERLDAKKYDLEVAIEVAFARNKMGMIVGEFAFYWKRAPFVEARSCRLASNQSRLASNQSCLAGRVTMPCLILPSSD